MVRNIKLDNLRGIAFILMIIHHIFYFYDLKKSTKYADSQIIEIIGLVSRYLFILLVGYSLVYLYKNNKKNFINNRIKKSIEILFHAAIITLITYYYYPNNFIRFGILHFIGLITLIFSFIIPLISVESGLLSTNLLYFLLLIFIILDYTNFPSINTFIDTLLGNKFHYNMIDYFPIIKWTPIILIGMILKSSNFELESLLNFDIMNNNNILTFFGQNSLNLYTMHIIVIILFYNYLF
jgi:uncharacterized membrane protein